MIAWALANWRLLAAVALAAGLFAAGWTLNGMRWSERVAQMQADHARAVAIANAEALQRTRETAAAVAAVDAARTAELQEARREVEDLRAAVDASRQRLRVAATCPARVPGDPAAAGLDDGAGPELTADARSAYFELRSGLATVTAQLSACQAYVRAIRHD